MVSGVQNGNLLQSVRAEQAFKNAAKQTKSLKYDFASDGLECVDVSVENQSDAGTSQNTVKSQQIEQENSQKTEFKSSLLEYKKDFVSDFKNFINKIGNFDVKDEDIDYALRYGKSILVDQNA